MGLRTNRQPLGIYEVHSNPTLINIIGQRSLLKGARDLEVVKILYLPTSEPRKVTPEPLAEDGWLLTLLGADGGRWDCCA